MLRLLILSMMTAVVQPVPPTLPHDRQSRQGIPRPCSINGGPATPSSEATKSDPCHSLSEKKKNRFPNSRTLMGCRATPVTTAAAPRRHPLEVVSKLPPPCMLTCQFGDVIALSTSQVDISAVFRREYFDRWIHRCSAFVQVYRPVHRGWCRGNIPMQ